MTKNSLKTNSPYNGSITREQFLSHEMRITARLYNDGLSEDEIIQRIYDENLYQFPTERMIKSIAKTCIKRLESMNDATLITVIATQPSDVSKQICLYAMMKQHRLVWDFMVTVIGEKYRTSDDSFGKIDVNSYMLRLQEQDELVASWSDATIKKIKQVLTRILVENEYLDNVKSTKLNPVWIQPMLENAIRANGEDVALPAFNCFS